MFNIAVHSRSFELEKLGYFKTFFGELFNRKTNLYISKDLSRHLEKHQINTPEHQVFATGESLKDVDLIFSLGGDGTLLETVTFVKGTEIPIMGINTGRLGFLSNTPSDHIVEAIDAVFNGFYELDKRTLIELESDRDIFKGMNYGLNEFAITKRDTSSMIVVHTYIDGEYLNSYWADGLIVATPTGSTGYSLSVGGPVVIPHSSNFIISPVSPHNLNVRPLVVSDDCVISFEIEGRSKNFLVSLDSRSKVVDATVQMAVKKCPHPVMLAALNGNNFLNTLRKKLNWGYDARN